MPEKPGKDINIPGTYHAEVFVFQTRHTLQVGIVRPVRIFPVEQIPSHAYRFSSVFSVGDPGAAQETVAEEELHMDIFQSVMVFLEQIV